MVARLSDLAKQPANTQNNVVTLQDVDWQRFEALRACLDNMPSVRLSYIEGMVSIMSPISEA